MRLILIILALGFAGGMFCQNYTVKQITNSAESISSICPSIYNDGFVFMSNEKSTYLKTVIDISESYPYNLYYLKHDSAAELGKKNFFAKELTTAFNDGPLTFYQGSNQIVFSRNINPSALRKKKNNTIGLYFSQIKDEIWSEPIPFLYNSEDYNLTHPAINEAGNFLVFSSSKNFENNGMDLFYTEKVNGEWIEPQPFSSEINTMGNEVYPELLGNKIFYSTNHPNDSTGLDIWTFSYKNGIASKPFKLDTNINSSADDFGITFKQNGLEGYFTSNRNINDQIFHFEKHYPALDNCPTQKKISYCYLIEEHNMLDESGMPLKFTWEFGDGTSEDGYKVKHCYDTLGTYKAVLNILDTVTGDLFYEVSEVVINISAPPSPRIFHLDTLVKGSINSFNADLTYSESDYKEIIWETEPGKIESGEYFEHNFANLDSTLIKMGVIKNDGSVTCVSKKVFFVDSSDQVKNRLPSNDHTHLKNGNTQNDGQDNFSVKIFSSEEPLSPNDSIFRNVDYPIQEDFFEFKKLYYYSVGNSENIEDLYLLYREMKELGYDSEVIKTELSKAQRMSKEKTLTVFFAVSQSEITSYNLSNIKKFAEKLSSTSKLMVQGYADPTGNFEYNKMLSLKRAKSVKQELIKIGINPEFIETIGNGQVETETREETQLQALRKVDIIIK